MRFTVGKKIGAGFSIVVLLLLLVFLVTYFEVNHAKDTLSHSIATNEKFLKGEFHPSKATEKDNKKRIDQNTKRCKKIEDVASENQKRIIEIQSKTQTNAIDIMKNSVQISERRERINDLQEKVNENQSSVAEMISIKIKN